jgi:gamma-butyrobetaine dioxygenase
MARGARLAVAESALRIDGLESALELSLGWLRAQCPCGECRTRSGQRLVGRAGVSDELEWAELSSDASRLQLRWRDGHRSQFALGELQAFAAARGRWAPFGMASRRQLGLARRPFRGDDAAVGEWLELLADNQVLLLEGVPCERAMVTRVARMIGPVLPTIYGESWLVTASDPDTNIAYSARDLPLHQDLSAYEAPPGLQLLHCLRFDTNVTGGESTFADALAAADALRSASPEHFRTLCEVWATFDKLNERQAMTIRKPHLALDDYGQIIELNWAPPFEGAYAGRAEREAEYARAYSAFELELRRAPSLVLRLQPGELLIFLNRRTLHGRSAFVPSSAPDGGRVLEGCYVGLDDVANQFARRRRAAERSQHAQQVT